MEKKVYPSLWKSWSPTKLGLLLTCPLAFFFRYVVGFEPSPNIFGVFGEAIHQMARKFFSLKNGYRSEQSFAAAWSHYWWIEVMYKKHGQLFKEVGRDKCNRLFGIGINILKNFYRDNVQFRQQGLLPLVEVPISCIFRDYRLSGRLDRIQPLNNGNCDISDYKTGLRKADQQELRENLQFTFYNLLYILKYNESPEAMWLYYLSYREKVKIPLRNEQDFLKLELLLDEAAAYVKNIVQPSSNCVLDLTISGLDQEDVIRRRFPDRQSSFCNICNYEKTCRSFQPNDFVREIWVQREIQSIEFTKERNSSRFLKEVGDEANIS